MSTESALHSRLETLKAEHSTREREHSAKLASATAEADAWKKRFEDHKTRHDIESAPRDEGAVSPERMHRQLPNRRVEPILDTDGSATGEYQTRVRVRDTGKSTTLDLSALEAVRHMKGLKEHANLFQDPGARAGLKPGETGPGTAEYIAARRKSRSTR